jgi:hypothetical protein
MNISDLSDDALRATIARLGKEMTAGSTPMAMAKEKERMIYIKELFKRGDGGMKSKKKYRQT